MACRKPAPPPEPLPDIVAIVAQYMANPTKIWPVLDRFEEDADAGLFGDEYDAVGRSTGRFEVLTTVGNLRPDSACGIEDAAKLWFAAVERSGQTWNLDRFSSSPSFRSSGLRLGFCCFSNDASWYSFQPNWNATSLEDVRWDAKRWIWRIGYVRGGTDRSPRPHFVKGHWQSAPVYFDAPSFAWANAGAAGLLSWVVAAADDAHRTEAANPAKGNAWRTTTTTRTA